MDDSYTPVVMDGVDDACSCGSVYHSIIDTPHDNSTEAPVSPPTPPPVSPNTFSTPELDSQSLKDQRSHERSRQRLKKPEDIRRNQRCVRCRYCSPHKWAGNGGRPKQHRGLHASLAEAVGECKSGLGDSIEFSEDVYAAPPAARTVTLADLVKPPRKGSDKQFEMVGRPRQVIVLDEFTEADIKLELEDWEHVEDAAKHSKAILKAPSYARVVASSA